MRHIRLILLLVLAVARPAAAGGPPAPQYLTPSSRVLGLYDGSEAKEHGRKVVLQDRARRALQRLGLSLVLRDVAAGLPPAEEMAGYRAVITAFEDSRLHDAAGYTRWLAGQLDAGRRVVILNNFGAYQDADTDAWLPEADVNRVFEGIGLRYDSQWTSDPSKLRIVGRDQALFKGRRELTAEAAAHYYRFRPVTDDVKVHLTVDRTDIESGRSAVVSTSPRGGMALTRYYESDAGEEYLDLGAFLDQALFPRQTTPTRVLLVLDPESSAGHAMEANLAWIQRYARLQADWVRASDAGGLRRRDLRAYGAVVLASDVAGQLSNSRAVGEIERWVREDGGGLVQLVPVRVPAWDGMLGIRRWSEKTMPAKAMRWEDGFFPGLEGQRVYGDAYDAEVHPVGLAPDAVVMASVAQADDPAYKGPPVLWKRRYGAGRVVVRNDGVHTMKEWRGSALQMILQGLPVAAAPIVNAQVYFVDDCPMPMWNTLKEPIKSELNMTDTAFYRDVFWPDLMKLAGDFGVKLTFGAVFSYDDKTSADFTTDPFYQDEGQGVPVWMAREAVRLGHEVALHGYNHQSLVTGKGYTSRGWPTRQKMVDALRKAREEWERVFGAGAVPFTYVAPNNHVERAGKEAIKEVFPEIRVMATQYLDEVDPAVIDGKETLAEKDGQEFFVDPEVDHFMDMPRVSSELYMGGNNVVPIHDAVMLLGAWTHFVHPDDVFDPERNGGMGWKGLRDASRQMLQHVRESYPWLRSLTARDAFNALVAFDSVAFSTEVTDRELRVHLPSGSESPVPFVVHLDEGTSFVEVRNGKLLHAYPKLGYYYLEGRGPEAVVRFTR